MYNKNRIKSEFKTIVGYRESAKVNDGCYGQLSAELKESDSCLYVNDLPKVTLQTIYEIFGQDHDDVNDFLADVQQDCIFTVLDKFVNYQKQNINTKELVSNLSIGVKAGNIRDYVTTMGRFVGYEITPKHSNSISASLLQLGIHFNKAVTDFPIYFYASSQFDPVKTFMVSTTKANSLEWVTLAQDTSGSGSASPSVSPDVEPCEVVMPEVIAEYIAENYGTGDRYFIGYYEEDLTAVTTQAIKTKANCSGCGNGVSRYTQYMTINPIEVNQGNTYANKELFNIENVGVTTETFGLNLKMNIKCDLTSIFIQNKLMFAEMIRYAIGKKIMWHAYNSDRLNAVQNTSKEDYRLMADKYEFDVEEELKTLSMDFSCLDKQCIGKANNTFGLMGV